ncbi:MAG: hypothetical protein CMJ18_00390 [Phycisphaeraceae bacterium]|nr:hypothetical protein [Phycisphaeraceae bacterium]
MPTIEILESGHVDRRDSAFPTLVRMDDGALICGYSVGGGAHVSGGTHCSRSTDGGRTWTDPTLILDRGVDPVTFNSLRLSRTADGSVLAYGQRDQKEKTADGSVRRLACEPTLCRSTDGGRTWSDPQVIPFQIPGPYEISNPIVVTEDGRWLAPAATFHDGRYGERVVLHESSDQGASWPHMHTVFEDDGTGLGYLEQKLIETEPGHMLALAWVQDYPNDTDLKNAYCLSTDGGRTWDGPHPTGIQGQTMTPIWLGDDRFLVLYNKRFGDQAVRMCLVRIAGAQWSTEFEGTLYDGRARLELTADVSSQAQISLIEFGLPMGVRLDGDTVLTAHWCAENGVCGIRWTRLRVA